MKMIINSNTIKDGGVITLAFMKHFDDMACYIVEMFQDNRQMTLEIFGLENVLEAHRHFINNKINCYEYTKSKVN